MQSLTSHGISLQLGLYTGEGGVPEQAEAPSNESDSAMLRIAPPMENTCICMHIVITYTMHFSKPIRFSPEKNMLLKKARNITFEAVIQCIESDKILDIVQHAAPAFSHQKLLVVEINRYAYVVPYVETEEEIFLKTIYPSRAMTKRYLE